MMRQYTRRFKMSGGKLKSSKFSPERQKLSFFFALIFLILFGLIVLAEVLFVETKESSGYYYDKWNENLDQHANKRSRSRQNGYRAYMRRQKVDLPKAELENIIKNISASMETYARTYKVKHKLKSMKPSLHVYQDGEFLAPGQLDFSLKRSLGPEGVWQPVNGTLDKFYVYSAFLDTRLNETVIRIIGVARTKRPEQVGCQFHFGDGAGSMEVVKGKTQVIRENWNLRYSAVFVKCPVVHGVPRSVSVVAPDNSSSSSTDFTSNQLKVLNILRQNPEERLKEESKIGVCVKPIHFNYNRTLDVIEFIELNRLLGVTDFTFYNGSVSEKANCVLQHYKELGIVKIFSWSLNVKSQTEIRTEGLFAALNDCLYRNMYEYNYLMLVDFDEFVIPTSRPTLQEMIRDIEQEKWKAKAYPTAIRNTHKSASYSFQNSFFYLQFGDDDKESPSAADLPLRVLKKTRRKSKFNPHKQRSKYICIPRYVREAGNHFIWEYADGFNVNVKPSVGYLHHYRVCEFGGDDCVHTESVVDRTVYRYKEQLTRNVKAVIDLLSAKCKLDHIWQSA